MFQCKKYKTRFFGRPSKKICSKYIFSYLNAENAEYDEENAWYDHGVDDGLERGDKRLHDETQAARSTDNSKRAEGAQNARDAEYAHDAEYLGTRLGNDVSDRIHGWHDDEQTIDAIPATDEHSVLANVKPIGKHFDHRLE